MRPKLGLLTDVALDGVRDQEIPFFEKLSQEKRILLRKLEPLESDQKREGLTRLRHFMSQDFEILHFACHALYEREDPGLSCVLLSNEFPVSLSDFDNYLVDAEDKPLELKNNPLVILNACETGNIDSRYTASFASTFYRHGSRGVLGTDCKVPDEFAGRFAARLYDHLLAGEPLGQSVLSTRKYFWREHHNPSGLLYSMYASPSIRLTKNGG
jgi:hypothetical protein